VISRATALRAVLMFALCDLAHLAYADQPSASVDATTAAHQIIVMLRTPPLHFRPDANYLASYDSRFGRKAQERVAEQIAAQFKLRIVDTWPMPSLGLECFVMEVDDSARIDTLVENISLDSRVESVQRMNLFHALSHNDPLYPLQPTATLWRLDELHHVATGKNVRVAEVDSGVELDHPDLQGRVMIARNFVDERDVVVEAHGTAVAGIIGARADNGVGIVGVAPSAALMALRACWDTGANENSTLCSSFTLAKALQFAIENNAKVINLSLGGPRDWLLSRLLKIAESRGVVVVAAVDPTLADGGFPASFPSVLAVAADDAHDSPATVLLAPGKDIPTTLPGKRWGLVHGSSFAAAQIAGLVALLFEIAPEQEPQRIRENLNFSAILPTPPRRHAIVDACAAVARTAHTCTCECPMARDAGPILVY
jgi:subtilisin family serine protease